MAHQAAICAECGAKVRADRERCPRCRAPLASATPVEAAAPQWLGRVMIGTAAAFVLVVAVLALTRGSEVTNAAARATPGSPVPPARVGAAAVPATAAGAPREVPFLEAPAAGALAYKAGDLEGALAQLQAAVERNPEDAESLSNIGQVLVKMGRVEEAVPFFERATGVVPERWAYRFNLARAQGLLNKWDEAISSYRQAQQLFPDDYVTTFNLARALGMSGDHAAAADEYKKAIELEPGDASFRMALGLSYEKLQKPAEAAAAYEQALRLAPEAPDAEVVRARIAQLTSTSATPPDTAAPAAQTPR